MEKYKKKEEQRRRHRRFSAAPFKGREAAALIQELREYEREGTSLYLEGKRSRPEEIASACMLAEETNYMRDFIGDEDQRIRKINFIRIKEK